MIIPYLTPFEFGAVGDCQGIDNPGTDDTVAIQTCIDTALTTGVKNIYLGNHRITDIDLTNLTPAQNDGLQFFSMNREHNSTGGFSNLFVSGSSSQGVDLSGTGNIQFNGITFSGDSREGYIPRCAIFQQRTIPLSGINSNSWKNKFIDVIVNGAYSFAGVYNYGGESWIFDRCSLIPAAGIPLYMTSKNTFTVNGITPSTKFATPSKSLIRTASLAAPITASDQVISLSKNLDVYNESAIIEIVSGTKDNVVTEMISIPSNGNMVYNSSWDTSGVNVSANTFTKTAHSLLTGFPVYYSYTSATNPIGGLTQSTTYYAIKVSNDVFKLATSYQNAINSVEIDITSKTSDFINLTAYSYPITSRALGGTTARAHSVGEAVTMSSINYHDITDTVITNSTLTTSDGNPAIWMEGSLDTTTVLKGYYACNVHPPKATTIFDSGTLYVTSGGDNLKAGMAVLTADGILLGRIIAGSGSTWSIAGAYAYSRNIGSSSTLVKFYIRDVPYKITAHCQGTTLTIDTGNPFLEVGMTILANVTGFGGLYNLGKIVSGSGNVWEVSIGNPVDDYTDSGYYYDSVAYPGTMEVCATGNFDVNNSASRIRIRDTYFRCNYAPNTILLRDLEGAVVFDGINDETYYVNSTDAFCKIQTTHENSPLSSLSYGNSVTSAVKAIRVYGTRPLRNFDEIGGNTFVGGGSAI